MHYENVYHKTINQIRHSPSMDLLKLGKYLRERRQELGLRAEEVARKAGISRAYLSILESGRNPKTRKPSAPSLEVAALLSRTLDLDLATLLELAGYSAEVIDILRPDSSALHSPEHRKLIQLSRKISDLDREARGISHPFRHTSAIEVPSGIRGFRTCVDDHILLVSEGSANVDSKLTLDFIATGLKHGESCLLRLPPSDTVAETKHRVVGRTGGKYLDRLTMVPWREAISPYERTRTFTRDVGLAADAKDLGRISGMAPSTIRFATPDASCYLAWVRNPEQVLESENYWLSDLLKTKPGRNFLLLCLYRMDDLEKCEKPGLSVTDVVLSLLESHNRVLYLTNEDRVLADKEAVGELLRSMDIRGAAPDIWEKIGKVGSKHQLWPALD